MYESKSNSPWPIFWAAILTIGAAVIFGLAAGYF